MRTKLRSKVTLLFMTLGLVLAIPAVALADVVIVNDVSVGIGNASKAPGDTGTANVWLEPENNIPQGDVNGCNVGVAGDNVKATVTLQSSDINKVYFGPDNAKSATTTTELDICDDSPSQAGLQNANADSEVSYKVASNAPGGSTATISVTNVTGGLTQQTGQTTIQPAYDKADTLIVNITAPQNRAPVAVNDALSTNEDTAGSVNVLTNDTDADGNALTVTNQTNGANGSVSCTAAGVCTYTPNANFFGSDSFTYTVSDGTATATGTVNVTVAAVNDAPVAANDSKTTAEDTPITFPASDLTANDSPGPNEGGSGGQTLTVTAVGNAVNGSVDLQGGNITFTPDPNFNGPASFKYTVCDNGSPQQCSVMMAVVNVTVTSVNDVPVANGNDGPYNVNEDATLNVTAAQGVLGNDTDADGDTLTAVLVTGPSNAAASGFSLNADGSFSYTPAADFNGQDSFTYKAKDSNNAESDTVTVTINVAAANDAPTCADVAIETNEDEQGSVAANCSDVDGDTLTYAIVDQAADGDASVDGGDLKYDPDPNFNGSDSFTYKANDGTVDSAAANVDVTVIPVNDPPDDPGTITSDESRNNDGTFTLNWGASTDIDGDDVTYTLEQKDADDGTTWSPVANGLQNNSYTFGGTNAAELEGTWDFRVKAVDVPEGASSGFSSADDLVNVDKTNPNAPTLSFATGAGQSTKVAVDGVDWYNNSALINVTAHGDQNNARDGSTGTGVDASSFQATFTVTQNGTSTHTKTVKDLVGNESAASAALTVHVDAANPTFGDCQGGPFLVNSGGGTQSVSITATDGESGIDSATSQLTKSVNTGSPGPQTVTFTAKDKVGHSVTKDCTYNVGAHNFSGFSSPVDNAPVMNTAKAGQAIPLKWRLLDSSGNPVTNLQSVTVTVKDLSCSLGTTQDAVEEYASGSSGLQNLGNGYYQYNWKSPTGYAKSCKSLQINGVGMQLTAQQQPLFQFTK